ncbi:hypothetical protein [Paenibacillus abyssi]|uniref:Uncharacterized protein n=1 Tax=Paenibacillus abyssi TaxID=1340531 RepID=A0A917CGN7_9BACL|nr:hypothetical protein [Paenibacillus abyssi]GGF88280.1 hypothetical protein GCM10010916_02000 [Paenibacillus abyssi]
MAKLTTAQLLAKKRAEVAELEAKMREEITVGSVVIVLQTGVYEDIPVGCIAKVTDVDYDDDDDEHPVRCERIDGSDYDFFRYEDLEVVTRETARDRLIADIDRELDEAFGGDDR